MKISRLYIKNFIVVMGIILVSQLLILGLFRFVWIHSEHPRLNRDQLIFPLIVQSSIRDYFRDKQTANPENLDGLLKKISDIGDGDLWVTDSSGKIIGRSSPKNIPAFPPEMNLENDIHHQGGEGKIYLKFPVDVRNGKGTAYAVINRSPREPDGRFIWGMAAITVFVALVLFPLSRKITNPLKKLTESAEAISHGDFDLKVDDRSSDEIGELAGAFNKMSDKVLQMIRGTRELTANVSHQIRSPLARISVAAEIIREKISEGDRAGAVKTLAAIERECAEIDALTGRIIELVRSDIAHKTGDRRTISVSALSRNIPLRYGDILKRRNIVLKSEIADGDISVQGIARDIEELFNILLDNAAKYTPDGGCIRLTLSRGDAADIFLLENSIASPLSDIDVITIFEPFNRKASEKIPGFGMGLAIAKKIAENHGWDINASCGGGLFRITVNMNHPRRSG
jgi:two-component system sensor histidine kinase CpxA